MLNQLIVLNVNKSEAVTQMALKTLSKVLISFYKHSSKNIHLLLKQIVNAVEFILSPTKQLELEPDVTNTWSTVVNIFKNLNKKKALNYDLLVTYKKAIALSINHASTEIHSFGASILDCTDGNDDKTSAFMKTMKYELLQNSANGLVRDVSNNSIKDKSKGVQQVSKESYLNRKSVSPGRAMSQSKKDFTPKKTVVLENSSQVKFCLLMF